MTDQQTPSATWDAMSDEQKVEWLEESFGELMQHFGLLPCNIAFTKEEKEDSAAEFSPAIGVQYNYPYPHLSVVICPSFFRMSEEEAKASVFHEVMHLLLWELKHFRKESERVWCDLEEKVVEKLAYFFLASSSLNV